MSSPFSQEAVQNGTYTKFMSILIISLMTLGMGAIYVMSLFAHLTVPDIFGQALVAGIVFFSKASGVADGATISQTMLQNTLPVMASAFSRGADATANAVAATTSNTPTTGATNGPIHP